MNILLPIILFGVLVTIHELGHFLTAKWAGVYVERFAIGFGPAIFKKKYGETEYAVCLLPLGGYVKMRGEAEEMDVLQKSDQAGEPEQPKWDPKTDPRSFPNISVFKRMAIVAMGPIANIFLPIAVFSIAYAIGTPAPKAQIGSVIPGYPAAKSGLRDGDLVTKINGKEVRTWEEVTRSLSAKANENVVIDYQRESTSGTVTVRPEEDQAPNMYGEIVKTGRIGIDFIGFKPTLGISNPDSSAAKLGLETGDVVTHINQKPISYWWQLEDAFAQNQTIELTLERSRDEKSKPETIQVNLVREPNSESLAQFGILKGELFIKEVLPNSVAEEIGVKSGDRIISLNGQPIASWSDFRKYVQSNTGEMFDLLVERLGKPVALKFTPKEVEHKDEFTNQKRKEKQLGVSSAAQPMDPALFTEKYSNPLKAMYRAVEETVDISLGTLGGFYRMITGKLSLNSLGGPISIFYLAGSSYKAGGWTAFFRMMAVLSITLAVINFMPIPMLDGGQLVFLVVEAIKGSPVTHRVQAIGNQIGLAFVLMLMVLSFYVDINRFLVDKIKALF